MGVRHAEPQSRVPAARWLRPPQGIQGKDSGGRRAVGPVATRRGACVHAKNRPAPRTPSFLSCFSLPALSNRMPQLCNLVNAPMVESRQSFASSPYRPLGKNFRKKLWATLLLRAGPGATAGTGVILTGERQRRGRPFSAKKAGFGAESGPFSPILDRFSRPRARAGSALERRGLGAGRHRRMARPRLALPRKISAYSPRRATDHTGEKGALAFPPVRRRESCIDRSSRPGALPPDVSGIRRETEPVRGSGPLDREACETSGSCLAIPDAGR
jgi:hypothetical protein